MRVRARLAARVRACGLVCGIMVLPAGASADGRLLMNVSRGIGRD
jgi:hypothetical protein